MGIRLKFIKDETVEGIEVTVKAKERTQEVERAIALFGGEEEDVLVCKTLTEEDAIDVNDVILVSKDGRFLSVKTVRGEFVLRIPLYKLEERLDPGRFVKISQSEIVNLNYVERWSLEGGGIIMVELTGGLKTYTSRRYTTEIRKILKKGGRRS